MAINPHDDYEALAKLLYPSIEASGNVYYGQTRKLAIDELFDKNNGGFESYFCSCRKEDDSSQYELQFHWKLGPFSDTVKIVEDTYKGYPLAWLKYSLTKNTVTHTNSLNSGTYNTYEVEYTLGQPTLYCTLDGSLPNGNMYNNSNFFLEGNTLYVLLYKAPVYEDMDKPLYIEAITGDIEISLQVNGTISYDQCKYKYGFDYNNLNNDLVVGDVVVVKKGRRIYIRCEDRLEFSVSINARLGLFSADGDENAEVAIGGNIESMAKFDETGELLAYAYYGLFADNDLITDASKLYIGRLSARSCEDLFINCSRLKMAPAILPWLATAKPLCYRRMFCNCSDLENAPILPARNGENLCYGGMFECGGNDAVSKLNKVVCLLSQWYESYTSQWLSGRTNIEIHALSNSNWNSSDEYTVPQNSAIIYLDSTIYTSDNEIQVSNIHTEKYLITHGTNNENNGRGDITDPSTLANMEKSFDENGTHQMNTYNSDGSFNQEIWGYKSFCSPVQFRNGIYSEDASLISFTDHLESFNIHNYATDTDTSVTSIPITRSCIKTKDILFDGANLRLTNAHASVDIGAAKCDPDSYEGDYLNDSPVAVYAGMSAYLGGLTNIVTELPRNKYTNTLGGGDAKYSANICTSARTIEKVKSDGSIGDEYEYEVYLSSGEDGYISLVSNMTNNSSITTINDSNLLIKTNQKYIRDMPNNDMFDSLNDCTSNISMSSYKVAIGTNYTYHTIESVVEEYNLHSSIELINRPYYLKIIKEENIEVPLNVRGSMGTYISDYLANNNIDGWEFVVSFNNDGEYLLRVPLTADIAYNLARDIYNEYSEYIKSAYAVEVVPHESEVFNKMHACSVLCCNVGAILPMASNALGYEGIRDSTSIGTKYEPFSEAHIERLYVDRIYSGAKSNRQTSSICNYAPIGVSYKDISSSSSYDYENLQVGDTTVVKLYRRPKGSNDSNAWDQGFNASYIRRGFILQRTRVLGTQHILESADDSEYEYYARASDFNGNSYDIIGCYDSNDKLTLIVLSYGNPCIVTRIEQYYPD